MNRELPPSSVCVHGFKHMCRIFSVNASGRRRWPLRSRAVDAGAPTTQSTQSARFGSQELEVKIFDCAIKEGPHYDLARTICMLYSTESEWGSNQLCSLSRQLIGMWSDAHPAAVPPRLPGRLTALTHTHTITEEEEGKGKNITSAAGLSFLFLFLNMCANMPPPSAHTPDKETMLVWCSMMSLYRVN